MERKITSAEEGVSMHIQDALRAIKERRPILKDVLDEAGAQTLGSYTENFSLFTPEVSIQPPEDFIDIACSYTQETLGEEAASKLKKTLEESPDILTADHFGPLNLGLILQGDIVYALSKKPNQAFLVAAFGGIPMNNINYTRGLALAREVEASNGTRRTVKTNLFPSSDSERLVSAAGRITTDMVNKGLQEAKAQLEAHLISEAEYQAQKEIFSYYTNPQVLQQPNLSHQIPLINAAIWDNLFTTEARNQMPDMIFLEMETIMARLLTKDFLNPDSAISHILFDEYLRSKLIDRLDGQYGCWDTKRLTTLRTLAPKLWIKEERSQKAAERREIMGGAGTMFFWGIDNKGRRINLAFDETQQNLEGIDDTGELFSIAFTPDALTEALQKKRILPSLFTSFTATSLLRGFKCYGGFMQADYLTAMRNGVADTFRSVSEDYADKSRRRTSKRETNYAEWAKKVSHIPTENYSTGIMYAVTIYEDNSIKLAGAIEMLAKGGLTLDDINKIRSLSLEEGNLLGVLEMYPKILRPHERDEAILKMTLHDIVALLGTKLITIQL